MVLVRGTDGIRLCRDDGYEAISPSRACARFETIDRRGMANLRAFASQARLWSLPLCGLDDRKLLALLRAGIQSRDLILLREGVGVSSAGKDSTAALRYLVRLIEAVPEAALVVPTGLAGSNL